MKDSKGYVYIVGAGTGDPELLTVKASRILATADVVLFDNLVSDEILDLIPETTEKVYVGKKFNQKSHNQLDINHEIIKHALMGRVVCRLKGGDPFVFGRGGEECLTLANENIKFEVVPGITAAIGCTAYAGIPVTHREMSRGMTVITGRDNHNSDHINWPSLANIGHTIVFYMGLHKASLISQSLIKHGMDNDMPVCIISNGTRENQSKIITTLAELPVVIETSLIPTPAIIVVGTTVSLSERLGWVSQANVIHDSE